MHGQFSEVVMDHFLKPRNLGTLGPPAGEGTARRGVAGPVIRFYVQVDEANQSLERVRFLTQGCVSAIAAASWVAMSMSGKRLEEAQRLDSAAVLEGLGGLPASRRFCADLAIRAFKLALCEAEKNSRDGGRP